MERILLIETSTALCSAALAEDGAITAYKESSAPKAHASLTAVFIQEMLAERGLTLADCDAVCVSMGPGSYTGLRVGVSTAKGLCFGAGKPLLAVGTLDTLVAQAMEEIPGQAGNDGQTVIPCDNGNGIHDNGNLGNGIPGSVNAIPDNSNDTPSNSIHDNGNPGNAIPDNSNDTPGNGIPSNGIPSNGITGSTNVIPGTDNVIPGSVNAIPDNSNGNPGNGIPGSVNAIPNNSNGIPGTDNVIPNTDNVITDTDNVIPDLIGDPRFIIPMIDARRMEVYTAVFASTPSVISSEAEGSLRYVQITETAPVIIDENSFAEYLEQGPVLFIGDGAGKCADVIRHPNAHFCQCHPKASSMLAPAIVQLRAGNFQDVAYFEPFYLKEFVATVSKKKLW